MTEPTVENAQPDEATGRRREFEGPRRRARREREERRAAQARATAIEDARREAKRRVGGALADEPKALAAGRFGA